MPGRRFLPLLLVLLLAGCSSLGRVPLSADPLYESQKMAGSSGLKIDGYSSPDGVFHAFRGKAWWTGPAHDSLVLVGRRKSVLAGADPSGDPDDKEVVSLRLARSDITTLVHRAPDGGKNGVLGLGIVSALMFAGLVVIIIYIAAYGGAD